MRTLRDFLLAESVLREGQEDNNKRKNKNKSNNAPPVPDGCLLYTSDAADE